MRKLRLHILGNLIAYVLIIFMALLNGCSDSGSGPLDINMFSVEDDVALGRQLDSSIRNNPKEYPILNNQAATSYLQAMVNEIIKSPEIKYKDQYFTYKVTIINDPNTVNAFSLPGGYVYVYTGLIKFLDNEATMAAVLGHEIAHAELRHATKRMTKYYGVSVLLNLLLGNNPSQLEEIGANLLTGLGFLANSREDEYQADEYSFKYLMSSIWYPGATIYFFDKINENKDAGFLATLLSTHPLPQDRIDAVNKLIKDANLAPPTETNLRSKEWVEYKKLF